MVLKIYNTLTREKQEFVPLEKGKVKMYVCGPTVYKDCHIGHGRSYVTFDVIRRYLEFIGYDVTYVQNFTDVDDKLIARANEIDADPLELSKTLIDDFLKDMRDLGVKDADVYPKVSEHIPDIIKFVQALIDKGYAYESGGDVYFSVRKVENYGHLSKQSLDDMQAGARVDPNENKRDPLDFALWKAAKEGEVFWECPWGRGRPGWHIECSTMAMKYLGETMDIHGGGMDLIFPHHENEILQSEAYTEKQFCRYWIHHAFLQLNKEKMSKSLDNFFTIREIIMKYRPEVVRFFLLNNHYKSTIEFSDSQLDDSKAGFERLENFLFNLEERIKNAREDAPGDEELVKLADSTVEKFKEAMDDDFNMRVAVSHIFDMVREVNKALESKETSKKTLGYVKERYLSLTGDVLNLFFETEKRDMLIVDDLVKLLINVREDARKRKDWATADKVRDRLKEIGIILEDSKDGTRYRIDRST